MLVVSNSSPLIALSRRGLNYIGTVGIVVLTKRKNLIPSGTAVLDQLVEVGFRMDTFLYEKAKALMDESD
jgi:predicted nucleic acid-binding protein